MLLWPEGENEEWDFIIQPLHFYEASAAECL
jgi:hypothetical protein